MTPELIELQRRFTAFQDYLREHMQESAIPEDTNEYWFDDHVLDAEEVG